MPKKPKGKLIAGSGVIYARYSSHAQKDASIEQQVNEASAYAKELGIQIREIYADRAISGKTDRRPEFQRMMHDAEAGKFAYVVAWKSNRMGRNMLQAMVNEAQLQELGIRVLYTEEDFDDTAAGRFALRSMMNVNQFYSENMAEDIKRGLYDNAENCKVTNGALPYGYKRDENLQYILDPAKAEIVREIFHRVAHGDTLTDIGRDLNQRGLRTSRGNPWGKGSFHRLLANERYRGIYIYGDVRVEGGIPRIVSDELFYKVQEVLKMKHSPAAKRRAGDYLLTGKLFCGDCKSPMIGLSGTGKGGGVHYYYVCRKKRAERSCSKANVRRDQIEFAVANAISNYALQDDVIAWIADSTLAYQKKQLAASPIGILEEDLAEVERSIGNIMTAIEQGIITSSTKSRLLDLEDKQRALAGKIAAEKANLITISRDEIIAGLEMFRHGDVSCKSFQAKLFDTFLVAVYVYDDTMRIVFSFCGNKNTIDLPLDGIEAEDDEPDAIFAGKCSTKSTSEPPER